MWRLRESNFETFTYGRTRGTRTESVSSISVDTAKMFAKELEQQRIDLESRYPTHDRDGNPYDGSDAVNGKFTGQYRHNTTHYRSAIIPLTTTLTIDGIGGIVPLNTFKIEKDKLPIGYQDDDIIFTVKTETQRITAEQDWTTSITGYLTLLDNNPNDGENRELGDLNPFLELNEVDQEREAWIGMRGSSATPDAQNLADITALANAFNTEHAVMTSSQLYLPRGVNGTLQFYPEWGAAVAMAGMRAGADIGEPLTFKNVRTFGVQYSWWSSSFTQTLDDNIQTLLLNGVCPIVKDLATNAFKIEKCVTTYISSQNNALSEESIVQGLKAVTANLRRGLDAFTGTKATLAQIQNIKDIVKVVLTSFGPEATGGNGFLIRSVGDDGSEIPPYRDIVVTIGKFPDPSDVARVSVTVTPVSGINFILNTVFAVPAQLTSSVL